MTGKAVCSEESCIEKAAICLNENLLSFRTHFEDIALYFVKMNVFRHLNTRKKERKRTLDTNNPVRRNVYRKEHLVTFKQKKQESVTAHCDG